MNRASWRSPETYREIQSVDAPGFAFQFATRDPAFREDHERLREAQRRNELDPAEATAFARRWGFRFRDED